MSDRAEPIPKGWTEQDLAFAVHGALLRPSGSIETATRYISEWTQNRERLLLDVLDAARHGLATLQMPAKEEAKRVGSTPEMCEYTAAKSLICVIAAYDAARGKGGKP